MPEELLISDTRKKMALSPKPALLKLQKNNRWYLNPSNKDRKKGKTVERDKVANARNKAYWKAVREGMDTSVPSKRDRELWDGYKDKYAKAILKDAKLNNSKKAREQVKSILSKIDFDYNYDNYDAINQGRIDTREERDYRKPYTQNRNDMIHYKRKKVKRIVNSLINR